MIYVIEGPAKSGKTTMAVALRSFAISNGRGALVIDEGTEGATAHQVEKLIDGDPKRAGGKVTTLTTTNGDLLKESFAADEINWKADPIVILVNAGKDRLAEIEALVPGFTKKIGPVNMVTINKGS